MESAQKELLTSILVFDLKLAALDQSIDHEIAVLNALPEGEISESSMNVIEDSILRIYYTQKDSRDFINAKIDSMTFLDIEYVKGMLVLQGLEGQGNPDATTISEMLDVDRPRFKRVQNDYQFYHALTNYTLLTRDSELIKKAIFKIQSL